MAFRRGCVYLTKRGMHGVTRRLVSATVLLDNYGSHKHSAVRQWLTAHPRFQLHFTPPRLLAQPRRELVQQADAATASPRCLS